MYIVFFGNFKRVSSGESYYVEGRNHAISQLLQDFFPDEINKTQQPFI